MFEMFPGDRISSNILLQVAGQHWQLLLLRFLHGNQILNWRTNILTCLWDAWVQNLGLPEALTITGSPLLQPILLGSGAPPLPWLGAWGWGRGATQGSPIPLCCLLGPLSLETHSRACQSVRMGMEQPGSKSHRTTFVAFFVILRTEYSCWEVIYKIIGGQFVIAEIEQYRCLSDTLIKIWSQIKGGERWNHKNNNNWSKQATMSKSVSNERNDNNF